MNVIGIDPSLRATGVALEGQEWTIKTKAKDGDFRLVQIKRGLTSLIEEAGMPGTVFAVIEDLPVHAHSAGRLGQVQGVVRVALLEKGVPYLAVPPATLKKFATDKGNATKADMLARFLNLERRPNNDDNQVDAYFLRRIGLMLCSQWVRGTTEYEVLAVKKIQEKYRSILEPRGILGEAS